MGHSLVPSFDTCLALAEADFPQQTAFNWVGRGPLSAPVVRPQRAYPAAWRAPLAAPILGELLAQLPAAVTCAVPHPIYGTVQRRHSLQMKLNGQSEFGYHLVGSFEVQYRAVHARAVEAAARLFLALHTAGQLRVPSEPEGTLPTQLIARAA